jgi:putative nucleotidyltransferase with HDIG domain
MAFLITAVCTFTGVYSQTSGFDLAVGDVVHQRFKATRRVENKVATERNQRDAEQNALDLQPIRQKDSTVVEQIEKQLYDLFTRLDEIRITYAEEQIIASETASPVPTPAPVTTPSSSGESRTNAVDLPEADPTVTHAVTEFSSDVLINDELVTPVVPSAKVEYTESGEPLMPGSAMDQIDDLQLTISDAHTRILLGMDNEHFQILKDSIITVLEAVMDQGVQEIDAKTQVNIQDQFGAMDITSEMRNIGFQILSSYIKPNFIIDQEATAASRKVTAGQYTRVYLQEGQTIVDEGQILSQEAYEILLELGMISNGLKQDILPNISALALEAVLFALCAVYISMFNKSQITNQKEGALLFTIYTIAIIAIRFLQDVPSQFMPILIFTMLVAMLIDLRLGVTLNIFITIIAMLITAGGLDTFIFYIASGLTVSLLSKYTTERSHIFIVGILTSVINFVLMFSIAFFFRRAYSSELLVEGGYAAINGIFTVILCLGSLPFWEVFFGIITNIKLLDLTNPTNPLLRRMTLEAPGTYHHSLLVANLAETAAYDVGADPNLTRVGGYYHDIGKLKAPRFFSENQLSENPHDTLSPRESAQIIISHITYGLELADKYKLPKRVKDFISQHHGTTLIQYFYCKAKDSHSEGDGDLREEDYRYPYEKPQSKETAILMLADTVEAAVRSMIKTVKDFDEVEAAIRRLIRNKLDDGQLLESQLSIKDLDTAALAFCRVFKGMYHVRIAYPKLELPSADKPGVV